MTDPEPVLEARRRLVAAMHAMHPGHMVYVSESLARELEAAWDAYDAALRTEGAHANGQGQVVAHPALSLKTPTRRRRAMADDHQHHYQPGWSPSEGPEGPWIVEASMEAYRFCPSCGMALTGLLDAPQAIVHDEPKCSSCNRPFSHCPCGCDA